MAVVSHNEMLLIKAPNQGLTKDLARSSTIKSRPVDNNNVNVNVMDFAIAQLPNPASRTVPQRCSIDQYVSRYATGTGRLHFLT